ncbi:hypothetical protein UFOVP53_222 [uncultured Caudovirales phage]|uniref:Uncharacterized protein n=1 Tax=uncultured Caudovirales phage TaxID=2100421 RepID=A0A6J5KXT9_9CAUD|nr:hypothetical protein UFOVP53_222 [uncultured Caudovirales phage]
MIELPIFILIVIACLVPALYIVFQICKDKKNTYSNINDDVARIRFLKEMEMIEGTKYGNKTL